MEAPESAAGKKGRCSGCQGLVPIPVAPVPAVTPSAAPLTSWQAESEPADYTLRARPDEQWYVALPDGRQLSPATWAQFQAAVARGAIPPQALIRRGDWTQPVTFATMQADQQAQAAAVAERARMPYGSYSSQLASNPLGTLLLGPKMAPHQANRDPAVRAARKRHFLYWVAAGLGLVGAHVLLPPLGGLLRLDFTLAAVAIVGGLFWVVWPIMFFAIGMFAYAGALFEWSWFFNSKRMRAMRAGGGDAAARAFYLYLGGFLMVASTAVSVVGNLGLALIILFTMPRDWQKQAERDRAREQLVAAGQPIPPELQPEAPPVQRIPPPEELGEKERSLLSVRHYLEQDANVARQHLAEVEDAYRKCQAAPNDYVLKVQSEQRDERAYSRLVNYQERCKQIARMVADLEKFTTEHRLQSRVLDDNRQLPPELVVNVEPTLQRINAVRAARAFH
jgi:hypothetical protein